MKKVLSCIIAAAVSVYILSIPVAGKDKKAIKWVDFGICAEALSDAMHEDIASWESERHTDWISLLAALAVRCGGDFTHYKKADLLAIADAYKSGKDFAEISTNEKLYRYYTEAYGAILGGFLGEYTESYADGMQKTGYGLLVFSPIAAGFEYAHYDDFGASRSYGYKRKHLGHDLMGAVGTPIIAVESGTVEACGWNQYGGWRVGIRSYDGKRYYYYAHLRRGHPFCDMYEGKNVYAGEVIGYLGMTGYSTKEDTNNIDTPHLHFGMQLIFEPSQKDGTNQIWIDMYALTKFLCTERSRVLRRDDGDWHAERVKIPNYARD